MSLWTNPGKALKRSAGAIVGTILGGPVGGAIGGGIQHAARGKSFAQGALRGGIPAGVGMAGHLLFSGKGKGGGGGDQGYTAPPPPESTAEERQRMSNEELLRKLQDRLYADEAALMQTNYPVYRGQTQAPMSAMTQNARRMRQERAAKPASHSRKVQTVLSRQPQGFNDAQMRSLLDLLGAAPVQGPQLQGQDAMAQRFNQMRTGNTSQNLASDILQKQFGRTYGYEPAMDERLRGKIGGDIERRMGLTQNNLGNLNQGLANLEGRRNLNIAGAFRKAGDIKEARREGLTRQLEEFGNQQHAFDNLRNQAQRDSFDAEAMWPQHKIQLAKQALQMVDAEEMHPSKAKAQNELLQQIQRAYGEPVTKKHPLSGFLPNKIAITQPSNVGFHSFGERSRVPIGAISTSQIPGFSDLTDIKGTTSPYTPYPGERVVGMEPETTKSFEIANRLSPNYRDAYHQGRKDIEHNFLRGDNNIASQIYQNIPENLQPLMNDLDYITQQQFKKATKKIAGEHVRRGTYGSGAHKAETGKALRSLARQMQMEREGALLGTIKGQGDIVGGREQNALSRYNMMAEHGGQEFGDVLRNNALLNQLGWTKRANKQADENEAMKEWYRQLAYEWPHMKQSYMDIGKGGYNSALGPFNNLATQYGTDLTGLFAKPATYNENQQAFNRYRDEAERNLQNHQAYLNRMTVG